VSNDDTPDPDELLGFLAEEGRRRRDPEEHPSPETLTAYQANELSPDEDERIQSHLGLCTHCTEMLLDLDEFLKPPAAAEPVADFEAAADWRKLQPGLRRPEKVPALPLRVKVSELDRRLMRSLRVYRALVATLGAITVGLTLYAVRHRSGIEVLAPTEESVYFATLRGAHSGEKPLVIRLPCALPYSTGTEYSQYRIEISVGERDPSYSLDTHLATGVIPLGTGTLKPGDYKLRLLGLKNGHPEKIGDPKALIVEP
jgi:hypothetical protein